MGYRLKMQENWPQIAFFNILYKITKITHFSDILDHFIHCKITRYSTVSF